MTRFDYAGPFKSRDAVESALEDMYATGDVCEGEHPLIEKRSHKIAPWSPARVRFYITINPEGGE